MDVNRALGSVTNQQHYIPRIRYTEMYLAYAEAANEAWGPKGDNGNGYSAYDVIKAIRKRAGIGGTSDPYLEQCAGDRDKMANLIRNERRLNFVLKVSVSGIYVVGRKLERAGTWYRLGQRWAFF